MPESESTTCCFNPFGSHKFSTFLLNCNRFNEESDWEQKKNEMWINCNKRKRETEMNK